MRTKAQTASAVIALAILAGCRPALPAKKGEPPGKVPAAAATPVPIREHIGRLELKIPESALISLAGAKLMSPYESVAAKVIEKVEPEIAYLLPEGEYALVFGFANPNHQPATEVTAGTVRIREGATTVFSLGALGFVVRDGLPDLNLSRIMIRPAGSDRVFVELEHKGNSYYFFKPKPLPEGAYDVAVRYYRSAGPSLLATNVLVKAGEQTNVALDAGFAMKAVQGKDVIGWDLFPAGGTMSWVSVSRGWDNDEPLWRRFIVLPGRYDVALHLKGQAEAVRVGSGVEVKAGQTLVFDTRL